MTVPTFGAPRSGSFPIEVGTLYHGSGPSVIHRLGKTVCRGFGGGDIVKMLRSDIVNDRIRVAQDKARKGIECYKISDRVTNLVATHKLPSTGLAMPTLADICEEHAEKCRAAAGFELSAEATSWFAK